MLKYGRSLQLGGAIVAVAGFAILLMNSIDVSHTTAAASINLEEQDEEMTWDDVHELAVTVEASLYTRICVETQPVLLDGKVMTVAEVKRPDGSRVPPGRILDSEEIEVGVVLTREALDVRVNDNLWFEAGESALLVVGPVVTGFDVHCSGANCCSTTCGDGFYACCYPNATPPPCGWCPCVPNGQQLPGNCQAGGVGSTGCSI